MTARDRRSFFQNLTTPLQITGVTRGPITRISSTSSVRRLQRLDAAGTLQSRDKVVPTGYFGSLFNDPRTKNIDHHQYLDLSYEHSFGNKWDLAQRTSYDHATLRAPSRCDRDSWIPATTLDTYSFLGEWWDSERS